MAQSCAVCQVPATSHCGRCKSVYYCGREHQTSDWKDHKKSCGKPSSTHGTKANFSDFFGNGTEHSFLNSSVPLTGPGTTNPLASQKQGTKWATGLDPKKAAEWFLDCFSMRMDDDQVYAGGEHFGVYYSFKDGNRDHILFEFLIFCKLAVKHGVYPPSLPWNLIRTKAKENLGFAFEKSDAQKKYGQENVFSILSGGRSLRFTAEEIYGFGVQESQVSKAYKDMSKTVRGANDFVKFSELLTNRATLFNDVGGVGIWTEINTNYRPRQ